MKFGKRTIIFGIAGSVLLHATFALAIVYLVTGEIPGFKGTAGHVFMVSFDTESSLHRGTSGLPAFTAPSVVASSRTKSIPPQRLKDFRPGADSTGQRADGPMGDTSTAHGATGGGADGQLVALLAPKPPFPAAARRAGFEGRVLLDVEIAPDGEVTAANITESSGRSDCDESARSTILNQWKFAARGSSGPVRQKIAVRFNLR